MHAVYHDIFMWCILQGVSRYVTNPEYQEWDAKRRLGLVGPELVERERLEANARCAS